ncbi:MAG: Gfo/Idh/MocA family oxidoreductase [Anaerolineae bacterium]|nr:Gfo/Idh/MocA family oxidoreductase [Anaerolineae bacterium]
MKEVTIAMVALGGYGNFYLGHIFNALPESGIKLVAGIDPNPVGCSFLHEFEARSIPIYPDLETCYQHGWADLVIIAAPIHLHTPFTITALEHGSSVLCEKPVAATIQETRAMLRAEAANPGFVGIGYQWSYAPAMQALKQDIIAGVLGRPVQFKTKILWPRTSTYYGRNTWAARIKSASGAWVLDSPANNATAHYLHNCFYVLGKSRESSALLVDVQAELYRANRIENYDTAAIRCRTDEGVEVLFYTAHPVPDNIGPVLSYEFEEALVSFDPSDNQLRADFHNGQVKDYGNPSENDAHKLWQAVQAVRTGKPMACGVQAASTHTLCINSAQESVTAITNFPNDLVQVSGNANDTLTWVTGLQETLEACYDNGLLPAEMQPAVPWAQAGRIVDVRAYREYPSR